LNDNAIEFNDGSASAKMMDALMMGDIEVTDGDF